jgi:MFS family permease
MAPFASKIRKTYEEFPPKFWMVILATFVDRLGGSLLFPFLSIYVAQRFNVGMTEVGMLFGFFAFGGLFGQMIGGALTDKFGRKTMIVMGLVISASSALAMGFVTDLRVFYTVALMVGLLGDIAGPAHQAMVADMLPEEKRAQGYAMLRVVFNLSVTIGPMIGGLLAGISYLLLFVLDAVFSFITAGIVLFTIPETKPEPQPGKPKQSLLQTVAGYRLVLKDRVYMVFILVSILMVLVYLQMNSTLSVFLNQVHGVSPQGFGYILSLNAGMVVLFQFWLTRKLSRFKPFIMMAVGTIFYAVGFGMYGFVSTYGLFLVAMVIITIGEMITAPVGQTLVASLAPEEMRGRYMAIFGLSWGIPWMFGPLAAGLIMDNLHPNGVWYAAILIAGVAAAGYLFLDGYSANRLGAAKPDGETAAALQEESTPAVQ